MASTVAVETAPYCRWFERRCARQKNNRNTETQHGNAKFTAVGWVPILLCGADCQWHGTHTRHTHRRTQNTRVTLTSTRARGLFSRGDCCWLVQGSWWRFFTTIVLYVAITNIYTHSNTLFFRFPFFLGWSSGPPPIWRKKIYVKLSSIFPFLLAQRIFFNPSATHKHTHTQKLYAKIKNSHTHSSLRSATTTRRNSNFELEQRRTRDLHWPPSSTSWSVRADLFSQNTFGSFEKFNTNMCVCVCVWKLGGVLGCVGWGEYVECSDIPLANTCEHTQNGDVRNPKNSRRKRTDCNYFLLIVAFDRCLSHSGAHQIMMMMMMKNASVKITKDTIAADGCHYTTVVVT